MSVKASSSAAEPGISHSSSIQTVSVRRSSRAPAPEIPLGDHRSHLLARIISPRRLPVGQERRRAPGSASVGITTFSLTSSSPRAPARLYALAPQPQHVAGVRSLGDFEHDTSRCRRRSDFRPQRRLLHGDRQIEQDVITFAGAEVAVRPHRDLDQRVARRTLPRARRASRRSLGSARPRRLREWSHSARPRLAANVIVLVAPFTASRKSIGSSVMQVRAGSSARACSALRRKEFREQIVALRKVSISPNCPHKGGRPPSGVIAIVAGVGRRLLRP